jgi:thiosulfate/3-mercaptopyruvate sulfurtransferase
MYASRLWWLLRWLGHMRVAVLDGGWPVWVAEGRPVVSGVETRAPRHFVAALRRVAVDVAEVQRALQRSGARLLDARSPDRFRGEHETIDKAAGHIPGATNHFFRWNVDDTGRFLPVDALRERLAAALGDTAPENVVAYCGSGVTACHNLLALEHAGLSGARLYPGSWSEWSSDPSRPIEKE